MVYIEWMKLLDSPIIFLSRKLWEFSKGRRHKVVLYVSMFVIGNVVAMTNPLIIGHLFNIVQLQGVTPDSFPQIVLTLFGVIGVEIVFWAMHGPARVIENLNAFFVRNNFKEFLLKGTMSLPPQWHTDHHSGDTIDKIEKATKGLFEYASRTFEVLELLLRATASYLVLIYFDLNSSWIVLAVFIITIFVISRFDKILVKQWDKEFKMENGISAKVFDVISNITTVIILRVEQLVLNSITKKMLQPFGIFKRNSLVNEGKWFLSAMFQALIVVLVLFSYLHHQYAVGGVVLVGTLYALYGYVREIDNSFFRFTYLYNEIIRYKTSVQNSEPLSNLFKEQQLIEQTQLNKKWKELAIQGLRFSYDTKTGAKRHLRDVSVTIKHGEKIAVIGDSGAGKTTFLKLFRGLYVPQAANISVDGQRLSHGFLSMSDEISLIPQDPEIFATTIKENITIGVPHTQQFIEKFVAMAKFTEVVERLPKKYQSSVVEKGVNLSGGEKQRLALARGLLASEGKSIILLDEPTSSVDTKNELIIYSNIFREYKEKTVISTIHRLHLLPLFDRIIIFTNGRVTADGSFQGLLQNSADFRQLWETYSRTQLLLDEAS